MKKPSVVLVFFVVSLPVCWASCIVVDQGTTLTFNDASSSFTYINTQMTGLQKSPLTQPARNAIELRVSTLLDCLLQQSSFPLVPTDYVQINATLIALTTKCTQFDFNTWTLLNGIFDMGIGSAPAPLQNIRISMSKFGAENLFGYCAPPSVPVNQLLDQIHEVSIVLITTLPAGESFTITTPQVQLDICAPGAAKISSAGGTKISLPAVAKAGAKPVALWVKALNVNPFPNASNVEGIVKPWLSCGVVGPWKSIKYADPFTMQVPVKSTFTPAKVNVTAGGEAKPTLFEYSQLKLASPFFFTIKPSSPNAEYVVLVWYTSKTKPNGSDPDMTVSLPTNASSAAYTVRVDAVLLLNTSSVYVSVKTQDSADFDHSGVQLGCRFFNTTVGDFIDNPDLCEVTNESTPTNVVFKSNYFGSLSATVFTPPNKIDFSTVFARFSELKTNYSVLATLCALAVFYLALLPLVIHLDRLDGKQWKFQPIQQSDSDGEHRYEISVFTSIGWGKGTVAPASIELIGDLGCSMTRGLDDGINKGFSSRSQRNLLLTLHRHLGRLSAIVVTLHPTEKLEDATWSLQYISIRDCTTSLRYDFHNSRPLCTRKNARVRLSTTQFQDYATIQADIAGNSKSSLCEEHLWVSVFTRPTQTPFGRTERLTCCLSILLLSMLTNMMFYNTDQNVTGNHAIQVGPFAFTIHGVYVSVISTLIVLPVNMAAMLIFKRTPPLRTPKTTENAPNDPADKSKPRQLPRSLRVLAWILLFLAVVASLFFMLLYSIEFGDEKSRQWLASVFLSLFEDIFIMNPMKVIVIVTAFTFCFVSKTVRRTEFPSAKQFYDARHYMFQDHKLSLKLRTAFVRFCCILVVAFLCANQRDLTLFLQNRSANQHFTFDNSQFSQISDVKSMWHWTTTLLLPNLFPTDSLQQTVSNTYFYRLGALRLRQVTVNTTDCIAPAPYRRWLVSRPCYPFYEPKWSSDTALTPILAAAANASNPTQLYSVSGHFATYPMAGPYVDMSDSLSSIQYINALESSVFIGRHTRAVIIEWNYYNPNTNLFTLVRVLFEMPPVGGVVATKFVKTVRLYTYTEDTGLLFMILQALFCLTVLGNMVSLVYQTRKQGCAFVKQFWTILQGMYILFALAAIGTFVYRTSSIISTVETLMNHRETYVSLDAVADADDAFSALLALLQLVAVLSMMQLLDFNRYVALFSSTLAETSHTLLSYASLFTILIFSYSTFSMFVFLPSMQEFRDLSSAMSTLFSMTLGSTLYTQLVQADLVLGRFFYLTFMLIVFLLMMNLFISLINQNYEHVKHLPMQDWFDQVLVEHLVKKFSTALGLKQKKDNKRLPDEGANNIGQAASGQQDPALTVERKLDDLYFLLDSYFRH